MTNGSAARRRPTLSAVATVAGTSVPTVSKVLRGGTGDRFRDEADAPTAIELVLHHAESTWMSRVLAGAEYEAAAAGLDVIVTVARENRDWGTRVLRRRSAGAVVVLVDPSSSQFKALSAAGIPVVLIDPMSGAPEGAVSVGAANWDGGRIAAEHLLALGHTRMGIVAGGRRYLYSTPGLTVSGRRPKPRLLARR